MSVFYVNSTIIKHNITYICHEFRRVEYVGKEEKAREEERITSVCSVERGLQVIGPATHVVTYNNALWFQRRARESHRGGDEECQEVPSDGPPPEEIPISVGPEQRVTRGGYSGSAFWFTWSLPWKFCLSRWIFKYLDKSTDSPLSVYVVVIDNLHTGLFSVSVIIEFYTILSWSLFQYKY